MYNQLKNRMKRTLILFALIAACLSFTQPMMAQDAKAKITLSFKGEALPAVFAKLEKASSYKFNFAYDDVAAYNYNGNISGKTVTEALNAILSGKPFTYNVKGSIITITKNERKMTEIGGFVISSEDKEPVIGAQVKIVGTQVATVTDINGAFRFNYTVSENTIVEVSYVGMKTTQAKAGDNMRIMMMPESKELDNVVVTGIFRKAKESYTGAVSTISSEQLEMYRGQNLLQTLKNVDASINFAVDNINGSNPNNLPNINIRGNSSLPMSVEEFNEGQKTNINTPLIIMDGFEISLTKLMDYNDEEIESINILKDAAATAIYGSRGANGVIVVVSKQPEAGKLRINVEAGLQLEVPDLNSYNMLNAAEKLEVERRAGLYDRNWDINMSNTNNDLNYKNAYANRLQKVLSGVDTDWLSKPLRTGVGQRYNLRVEGGSNEFRWSADAQYNDVQGAMKGSDRKTFTGGITLLYKLKNLTFRNYTSVGFNRSDESPYGSFSQYVNLQPYNSPYDENGNYVKFFDRFIDGAERVSNPLYDATLNIINKTNYQEFTNNFAVDWNILPELIFRGQIGISTTTNTSDYFLPAEHTYFWADSRSEYNTSEGFMRRGLYRYGNTQSTRFNSDITLAYNKIFNDVHSLYAGVNWSLLTSNSDGFRVAVEGFANSDKPSIANARQYKADELPTGSNTKAHQFGVTGNINYTYNSRYYLDLSYRVDGNSMYGSEKKYASFYSVGIGWNVHQENFIKAIKEINMLRLKASIGETGSTSGASETDAYTYYRYLTDNKYMNWTGAQLGGLGNKNLSWQTTKAMNIGIEFGLLDNRIKGQFDVYSKNTSNLLSSMDMPLSMGFSSYRANVGEVKNSGFEAALQGFIIRDAEKKIDWMIGGQLVYNKNEITKLSDAIKAQTEAYLNGDATSDEYSGIQHLFYEGRPQNSIYAVRSLGIDPSTGKEIFLDKDGNITDTWNAKDKVYLGSADPKFRGNLNSMFRWKDFTFNIAFNYYWGGKTYNSTLRDRVEVTSTYLRSYNADKRVLESRWYNAGDIAFFSKIQSEQTKATSRYVMDDNVLELSSISLQYKLHNAWLMKNCGMQSAVFAVNMNDLAHWGSIKMERGTSYPYSRNIQFSLKLMF